jgi:hypothetical protein
MTMVHAVESKPCTELQSQDVIVHRGTAPHVLHVFDLHMV